MFPRRSGVSTTLGARTIIEGTIVDYDKHYAVPFGSYCQVHEDRSITNTMLTRTTGAIALYSQGNRQGGYYFLSLSTWKVLARYQWTEIPMTDNVIKAVEN